MKHNYNFYLTYIKWLNQMLISLFILNQLSIYNVQVLVFRNLYKQEINQYLSAINLMHLQGDSM